MESRSHILGIDVGSVSVSWVEIDTDRRIVAHGYATHHGRIREAMAVAVDAATLRRVVRVAATAATPEAVARSVTYDSQVAAITAARRLHPGMRSLLVVGGERFSLSQFERDGQYRDTRFNSSCAAGTGSFLDQQARVLGLGDSAALAAKALEARGDPPRIASRCAVFARTDLIHAQQEGHGLSAICNGLCQGLANIVADTVAALDLPGGSIVFAGGVALNPAVRLHLEKRLGARLQVDELPHLYGALGAALLLSREADDTRGPELRPDSAEDLVSGAESGRDWFHEPLDVDLSDAPDFSGEESYEFRPVAVTDGLPVEMDIYRPPTPGAATTAFLGVDVGSTSTKAVLLDRDGSVLAGAYTRTAGRPLRAMQSVLEAFHSWRADAGVDLRVAAAGTTGSGRKLIGAVIGADLAVDEISAHARAAYELDPEIDTIIEIGGQDAKFTTLRNGMVTCAVMNTVCAAGTGSFIEEQAKLLGCPLSEYSEAVAGARAPLASDRCTVFMQRDINHLVGNGYSRSEVLATVLHAVRENYLQKVAREGRIGERICFQGATAKNRALVAAFEQRLGKRIRVFRFCHLTGALGVALMLSEAPPRESGFRGLRLHREKIPIRNEVCDLCANHCKIVTADVMGETAAYGFLCGRDYDVGRFVSGNTSGFDLMRTRRRITRSRPEIPLRFDVTMGLPSGLYVFEELELWRRFFHNLGVRVVTSEACADPVGDGKKLARAEFCAPMAAWHGNVAHILDHADFVFAPVMLEDRERERGTQRQYCYYSQYAASLAAGIEGHRHDRRVVRPLLTPGLGDFQSKVRLYGALRPVLGGELGFGQVASAYSGALAFHSERRAKLREVMRREIEGGSDIAVVLLGRPYTCLDPRMNKGIPDILGTLSVKTFFQDMLEIDEDSVSAISELLGQVHWNYPAKILAAAWVAARTPGLYPVLVTTFKCAPDSFTIEFFRRILDREEKPYLVLELDEHDSSVGYETRIEAAVRSFRNHRATPAPTRRAQLPVVPEVRTRVGDRILFLPNWDRLSCALVAANLRREGIDAHVLPETELTIRKSLRHNTGQCIPMNAILEGFVDEVRARGLDPGRTALWMIDAKIPCNIGMYPGTIKAMLEARGGGFGNAAVYRGDITCIDISVRAAVNTYLAYLCGGMLRRTACRIRPYEERPGETDAAVTRGLDLLLRAFEEGTNKRDAVREAVDGFLEIGTRDGRRPKVAIFGDLYVRDNAVMSQGLVRFIEEHGGEVITTPYSEYSKIIAEAYFQRWFREGKLVSFVVNGTLLLTAKMLEKQFYEEFSRILGPQAWGRPRHSPREILARFAVTERHSGESVDNILKVFHILETDPDVSLFVQANPAFCCPSLVTEAMAGRIRELTGVPVVTVTYDGTATPHNEAIIPYLEFAGRPGAPVRVRPRRPAGSASTRGS